MSGAQGALPVGTTMQITYESVARGDNQTRASLYLQEDEVDDPARKTLDPVFSSIKDDNKDDSAVTGTAG